ncbi:MAG: 2-amino-4-hydroxy-6-hydroxymethyldihydropteridine diphosphokinase [Chloroflexi bacterium]|nr:2-amino-4-hydroxy-6-hydroxymethyldihydropteridine diphosphokinase [Chloroflexota bacterium]
MTTVYLGLGANVGDRLASMRSALRRLGEAIAITAVSTVYETEPVGYLDQPRFLNLALAGRTALSPHELLALAKRIEAGLGRTPSFRNAPRPIDVDILLYGDETVDDPDLTIPHPRLHERAFALVPLAEIAPSLRHPRLGRTIAELAELPELAEGRTGVRALGSLTTE